MRAAERSGQVTADHLYSALETMARGCRRPRPAYIPGGRQDVPFGDLRGGQNRRARQTVNDLNAEWHRLRPGMAAIESRMTRAIDEHRAVADAIADRDPERAEAAMRNHLQKLADHIRALLEDFVAPLTGHG